MSLTKKQIYKKYEPRGDGILKFKVLEIKENAHRPYTVAYKRQYEYDWVIILLTKDFKYNGVENIVSGFDLIPKEERLTGWVNVYKAENDDLEFSSRLYPSHDKAFNNREQIDSYFATIYIDVKKGDSDE